MRRYTYRQVSLVIVAVLTVIGFYLYKRFKGNQNGTMQMARAEVKDVNKQSNPLKWDPTPIRADEPFFFGASESDYYPDLEVSTVHYLWCGKKYFRFENYLSVMSIIKNVRPMKIVFHYTSLPVVDKLEYFTWFNDIKKTVPNLVLHHLGDNHECQKGRAETVKTAWQYVGPLGGMFVGENTIVKAIPFIVRKASLAYSLPVSNEANGVIYKHVKNDGKGDQSFLDNKISHLKIRCCVVKEYENDDGTCSCVAAEKTVYPKDIWTLATSFGELARWIAYGKKEKMEPKPNFQDVADRIAHYIWFGSRNFDHTHYLSVLSSLYVAGLHRVYFHGDIEPLGPIWQKVKAEENVTFIFTETPESVYLQRVTIPQHCGDIAKVYSLLKYGGVSTDPDVYWLKYVTDELLAYDSNIGFDWPLHEPWPETFNMGVMIAKKNSKYVRELLLSFKKYDDPIGAHSAIDVPYRVYEKYPDVVFANRHLQVICFYDTCHPPWLPNYIEAAPNKKDHPFDWKTEAYSIHVTMPKGLKELQSVDALRNAKGKMAEIGRMILKNAGKWKE